MVDHRVLVLPYASCVSDQMAQRLREYVEGGGTLVVNGRAGLLGEQGLIRADRPLDDLLGVSSPAGMDAITVETVSATVALSGSIGEVALDLPEARFDLLEPGITATTGSALAEVDGASLVVVNEVGEGRAITLNFPLRPYNAARTEPGVKPMQEVLVAAVESAGIHPPATVTRADGSRPVCTQLVEFGTGPVRYLGLGQDILALALDDQRLRVELPAPAVVYDVRAGERIGEGRVSEWEMTVGRGTPRIYALLPYEVQSVSAEVPDTASPGATVSVSATVGATAQPATHVIRMNVYAPDTDRPHRQYSQNLLCVRGEGSTDIPFALSDEAGEWRIEFTDVASGFSTVRTLRLQ